jgi:hypothetical protein
MNAKSKLFETARSWKPFREGSADSVCTLPGIDVAFGGVDRRASI